MVTDAELQDTRKFKWENCRPIIQGNVVNVEVVDNDPLSVTPTVKILPGAVLAGHLSIKFGTCAAAIGAYKVGLTGWYNFPSEVPHRYGISVGVNPGLSTWDGVPAARSISVIACGYTTLVGSPAAPGIMSFVDCPLINLKGIEALACHTLSLPWRPDIPLLHALTAPANMVLRFREPNWPAGDGRGPETAVAKEVTHLISEWRKVYQAGSKNKATMGLQRALINASLGGNAR